MVLPGNIGQPALGGRAFRSPLVVPETTVREASSISFGDLVRTLAEGLADAQTALDRASAELVLELANTTVEVVPSITQTIDAQGQVSYSEGAPRRVSLLSLGVRPTFYQFSQSVVEVAMDIKLVESEVENGTRRYAAFADTSSVRFERKLNRDVTVSSKLTATLVPVPMPLHLEPVITTTSSETG